MRWFRLNKRKHKASKLPPLFKCISCQRRPGEIMHEGLPLCTSCAADLHRAIERHGLAILEGLDALRAAPSADEDAAATITEQLIHHTSHLVKYEEKRLKTIDPSPTTLLHLLRTGELGDVEIHLYLPKE